MDPDVCCPRCNLAYNGSTICWCGYNFIDESRSEITSNELFIYLNTKTSHKRYESMVVYALHYALREVELLSQFHVKCLGCDYYIDIYIPSVNLAVEIDEPYHEFQSKHDADRQNLIEERLGCSFYRINCRNSLYSQVDDLIKIVKGMGPARWLYQRPLPNSRNGEYSERNWERISNAGIPERMACLGGVLKENGFVIRDESIRGIPSVANGEYGFIVSAADCIDSEFALYSRSTGLLNLRLMKSPCIDYLSSKGVIGSRQNGRYYEICSVSNGSADEVKIIKALNEIVCVIRENNRH